MSLKDTDTETLDNVLKARIVVRKIVDLLDKTVEFESQAVAALFFEARKLAAGLESALTGIDRAVQGIEPDQLDLFSKSVESGQPSATPGPAADQSKKSIENFFKDA